MFLSHRGSNDPKSSGTPDLDDEDSSIIDDADDADVVVDVDSVPAQKPHFLDDAMPPPELVEHFDKVLTFGAHSELQTSTSTGEQLKMDKKYERDGEISDYELAASGYTKKEFTQDDNTLHLASGGTSKCAFAKPKHFLDENPIPPDYMLLTAEHEMRREHHSLDRNFERQGEQQRSESFATSPLPLAMMAGQLRSSGRKSSLDRGSGSGSSSSARTSRERNKESHHASYTLSRFLDSDALSASSLPPSQRIPKGAAWTGSFDSRYGSLPMPHPDSAPVGCEVDVDVGRLGPKVECVYSLLSMLGSNDSAEMSKKFLELSRSPETCTALRRAGCIPLLVQMMHAEGEESVRKCAGMALHNVVHSHPDEKAARREAKVLRLLEQIMDYCNFLKTLLQSGGEAIADDSERHPLAAISSLMKVSFDEEHRHAMCELGALQAIPNLVHLDHAVHGPKPEDQCCNSLRRYALMALTNLTFGDENNKALLCSQKLFMEALVAQLDSAPDDLLQVTASVLRNLSWRADSNMKAVLNEIGTVTALARAAMKNKSENTLKAILSALWNLSAHCSTNKAEFCAVDGALAFLVDMLTYEGPSKTLKIIENAGGILRNVSSHIAVREHYRQILRERNCLSILLQQLKSESLTVVSNSCGTLWNLSARCPEDQKFLWDNGAVPMLRSLIHSKHAMISEGSSSALKNLLNFRPAIQSQNQLDPIARSMGLRKLPTLNARKQKALEQELGEKQHAETCDNLDIISSGVGRDEQHQHNNFSAALHTQRQRYPPLGSAVPPAAANRLTRSAMLTKSESRDSVFSAKSDTAYENLMRSHSASDANRKVITQKMPFVALHLENDVESIEVEQPIDYSAKYCENAAKAVDETAAMDSEGVADAAADASSAGGGGSSASDYATYQETDLDQPTDFSLRYAEHQIESDVDLTPPEAEADISPAAVGNTVALKAPAPAVGGGSEILLILEDTVKCYQTEDTPYVISNAASVTDLRQATNKADNPSLEHMKPTEKPKKYQRIAQAHPAVNASNAAVYGSGSYTPEKPINYCEEGTPGYFSRYESLSSLDESPPTQIVRNEKQLQPATATDEIAATQDAENAGAKTAAEDAAVSSNHIPSATIPQLPKPMPHDVTSAVNINSAQETPLMFSRHSSMDSLVEEGEEEIGVCDDKSSVVSDFSRLASGVISPSEIPDSPTQSVPQSPRRNSTAGQVPGGSGIFSSGVSPLAPRSSAGSGVGVRGVAASDVKRPLRSVFEDDLNMFHVENTPAQFSCATSLSNLSIVDDENSSSPSRQREQDLEEAASLQQNVISEGEEEESGTNNDDLLLANCITMGMNRATATAAATLSNAKKLTKGAGAGGVGADVQLPTDEPRHYYTEDTPALLSKVGSNTNLSAISICSSGTKEQLEVEVYEINVQSQSNSNNNNNNRHSLNLSDDVSSNASECGATGQSFDILQQCIRVGMKKPASNNGIENVQNTNRHPMKLPSMVGTDAIAMLRRGGNELPPYLPVKDEMSKYLVEDSPCNFSIVSGLSNLTVGSSLVGPAVQLQGCQDSVSPVPAANAQHMLFEENVVAPEDGVRMEQQWQDDSLSSLSIDSEDDTNLLSQAIAAGCNRPKSNLGFSSTSTTSNKRTSLSASQPIPINAATSASSLTSSATSRHYQRHHHATAAAAATARHQNGNDSYSSVDSSDSNDNQSKSLFELCIRTGMHKSRDATNSRRQQLLGSRCRSGGGMPGATQSNPNLKQFDSLPTHPLTQQRILTSAVASTSTPTSAVTSVNRHLRERERKDEKLLLECINTGISKKIGGSSAAHNASSSNSAALKAREMVSTSLHPVTLSSSNSLIASSAGPKNVQATSVAALAPCHPNAATTSPSAPSTAAPDVKTNSATTNNCNSGINSITLNQSNSSCLSENLQLVEESCSQRCDGTTDAARSPTTATTLAANHQSHVNAQEPIVNGTGCREESDELEYSTEVSSPSASLENTASDDSNESFIMETTVSLEAHQRPSTALATADKHKDPDLMLKSVERLTLEFVSSAEQLRTNGSSGGELNDSHRALGSISVGGGSNSNNTWNEDTCPNDDVSFPSVSVTAPVVTSLNYDDEDEDDDVEQATEADHKELHDFAEITPTNEEQPQPSLLGLDVDDMYTCLNTTQPSSLETETETETLVHDDQYLAARSYLESKSAVAGGGDSSSSGSGINFKLGGAVQSAAASVTSRHLVYGSGGTAAAGAMSSSAIIAFEARALAENLQQQNEDHDDLTFSINSLDLDNIRPPSGMESLNISGYYQELSPSGFHSLGAQPNSMQQYRSGMPHSPQLSTKSPKFPRKSLPYGLVAKRALGQLPAHLSGSAESVNSSCNLLDNIKPPSLMDELLDSMISVASIQSEVADCESSMATTVSAASNYETAAGGGNGDFDDNTVTLQSCFETMPHDHGEDVEEEGSLHGGTPLPNDDCEYSSAESSPQKSGSSTPLGGQRTLTPKQKRKEAKDRYRTYTIATDMAALREVQRRRLEAEEEEETMPDETLQIEIIENVASGNSPNSSRRRADAERYKTQTIVYPGTLLTAAGREMSADETTSTDEHGHGSLTSTDDCPSDDASSIRAMTQRFKFINTPLAIAGEAVSGEFIAPIETTLNGLRAAEEDYTSMECDQNSETESCHGHDQHYTADVFGDSDDNVGSAEEEEDTGPVARASCVKSGRLSTQCAGAEGNAEEQAKKIRGRKKPAYVSPYSMQYQRTAAPLTRIANSKLLAPTASSGNAFRKRDVNSANTKQTPRLVQKRKPATTTTTAANAEQQTTPPPPAPLERQGTFVQDEPTIATEQVPVVVLETATTSPVKNGGSPQRNSKLPTKRATTLKTSPVAQAAATRKLPTGVKAATATPNMNANSKVTQRRGTPTAAAAPQRSNSNASIRVTASAARIAVLSARVSATTPPSRSNSSLNCNTAATSATKSAAAKISQAQSRIASIWKRVDEVKSKQHQQKKTTAAAAALNVAISPKTQPKSSTALNAQKPTTAPQTTAQTSTQRPAPAQKQQMVRSSTFDNTPMGTDGAYAAALVTPANASRIAVNSSRIAGVVGAQRRMHK